MRRGMTSDHFRVKFCVDYGVFPISNNDPYRCFNTLCWRTKFILEWWQEDNVVSCLSGPRNILKVKGITHPLECARLFGVYLRLWLESYQHGYWIYLTFQQTPLPILHVRSDTVGPRRTLRTIPMNSEHQYLWRTTSGKKIANKYFFNCLNPPLLNSNLAILFLCPPPPPHLKLGIVNLRMHHLFSLHPHFEKEVAKTLGIVQKD